MRPRLSSRSRRLSVAVAVVLLLAGTGIPLTAAERAAGPAGSDGSLLAAVWSHLRAALSALSPVVPTLSATDDGTGDGAGDEGSGEADPTVGDPSGGLDPGSGGGVMDPNG